jgi:dinuclear metal center YbgI/SA1388 family protein
VVERGELEKWLIEYLGVYTVKDYLPNGLQIEGTEEIKKIVTAVSINLDIVKAALQQQADTIIVHHGMFWKNDEKTIRGYRKFRIQEILTNNMNLFAFHLPLDLHPEISHSRLILKGLQADRIEDFHDSGNEYAFGIKGIFNDPISFHQLVSKINQVLATEARFFHYGVESIGSLYVVSGAGRNLIDKISKLCVDAYLTGDAGEGTECVAKEEKLNYIYAGHYNTEKLGIIELGNKVEKYFDIKVNFIDTYNPL